MITNSVPLYPIYCL